MDMNLVCPDCLMNLAILCPAVPCLPASSAGLVISFLQNSSEPLQLPVQFPIKHPTPLPLFPHHSLYPMSPGSAHPYSASSTTMPDLSSTCTPPLTASAESWNGCFHAPAGVAIHSLSKCQHGGGGARLVYTVHACGP